MMLPYPPAFTTVTAPLGRTPTHLYPRNYADGMAAIKSYESRGYTIEYVPGGGGLDILNPPHWKATPPEQDHTYSPELAEIHTRLCDATGYAGP